MGGERGEGKERAKGKVLAGGRSDKGDLRVARTEQEMGRVMGTGKKGEGGGEGTKQERNKRGRALERSSAYIRQQT